MRDALGAPRYFPEKPRVESAQSDEHIATILRRPQHSFVAVRQRSERLSQVSWSQCRTVGTDQHGPRTALRDKRRLECVTHALAQVGAALSHQSSVVAHRAVTKKVVFDGIGVKLQRIRTCDARGGESVPDQTRMMCGCALGAEYWDQARFHRARARRRSENNERITDAGVVHTVARARPG